MLNTTVLNLKALNTSAPNVDMLTGVLEYNNYSFPNQNVKITKIMWPDSTGSLLRDIFDKANSHWEGLRNYFFKEKYFEILWVIDATSSSQLQEEINSMVSAIASEGQTLKYQSQNGEVLECTAHCESRQIEREPYHITFVPFRVRFVSLDPFLQGVITQESLFSSKTTTFTDTVAYTKGTYIAKPTITITFSTGLSWVTSTAVQIGDNTITFAKAISNGDIVVINAEYQDVLYNGTGWQDYTGSFPELALGDNSMTVTINGTWTANVSVTRNNTYV